MDENKDIAICDNCLEEITYTPIGIRRMYTTSVARIFYIDSLYGIYSNDKIARNIDKDVCEIKK